MNDVSKKLAQARDMLLKDIRDRVSKLAMEYQLATRRRDQERVDLVQAKDRVKNALEAQRILQAVAQSIQQLAHQQIAKIVTRCLQAIWPDDAYKFRIEFVRARGKTEARLLFCRGDLVLEDPLNEASGGMIQVAAFALQVADLMISQPAHQKVLLLDEPFAGIHADCAERVKEMLLTLTKEMGMQVVLSTHNSELQCGKVVRL